MARNVIAIAKEYFKPMFDYFHRELLKRQFIMMDESPVQVLNEIAENNLSLVKLRARRSTIILF